MQEISLITALRDFFLAVDGHDLRTAYLTLAESSPESPQVDDWEEMEYEFNRLFVGPQALPAPPYASAYLEPEGLVMGEITLKMRKIYEMIGLVSPWVGQVPDDHLGLELDAAAAIAASRNYQSLPELEVLYHYVLEDHLAVWLPLFFERIKAAAPVHPAIIFVVHKLMEWLEAELSAGSRE